MLHKNKNKGCGISFVKGYMVFNLCYLLMVGLGTDGHATTLPLGPILVCCAAKTQMKKYSRLWTHAFGCAKAKSS